MRTGPGVFLDVAEAQVLVALLERACEVSQPSPRALDATRRLRKMTNSATPAQTGRAQSADDGHLGPYDLVSAAEAADLLGCSLANVRHLRARGRIPAHRAGGVWLYPAAAIVAYAEQRRVSRRR